MKKNNFTKGFTLIELLVVVAIIGILAAIVYAPLQTALRKGRDAKKISEMKSIQSSLMMYADSNGGSYPTTLDQLNTEIQGGIPKNYATTTTFADPNKYHYTAYEVGGRVMGYHLYVHLETASPSLEGAAKCRGHVLPSAAPAAVATACFIGTGVTTVGVAEPTTATAAKFLESERTVGTTKNDTDKNCAGDITSCIYDIRG
ncbi:hypothetical protein SDC9_08004 [bioreactor metagenome]|uniref:Type II secretion system protein G n=1 Tax=bioreactor metagenome TaxID=1076179 RepID=A0A644T6D9_9ZZZZ